MSVHRCVLESMQMCESEHESERAGERESKRVSEREINLIPVLSVNQYFYCEGEGQLNYY